MKKILLLLVVVSTAFIMVISSCTKEADKQEEVVEKSQENPSEIEMGDGVHSITLSFPETKTAFGDSEVVEGKTYYKKNWTVGDKICINGRESLGLEDDNINEDKSSATFYFEEPIPSAEGYQVVYPSKAYNSSTKKVTIPAKQTFISGNFDKNADIILGYGTNLNDITLSNAVAYLKIRLKKGDYGNFGVKEVKLEAIGKKLNGEFDIADGGLALTVPSSSETASEQAITLDASAINPLLSDAPTEFLLAVAPQTLGGGFTVTITDTKDNTMSKTKPSSAELAAGGILAQQAFNFQEYRPIATADDLLAFAAAAPGNTNYWLVTDNIDMNGKIWGACGTADSADGAFNGVFDGGNKGSENGGWKISNFTSNTGSFINYLWSTGTVKNVTLSSGTVKYPASAATGNIHVGSIVGMNRGTISYCYNRTDVSCEATSYTGALYVGGIVARSYRTGDINHCYNYGNVSCTASSGSKDLYIGGIIGSLEIHKNASDNATINNSENHGSISADPDKASSVYAGGVIGKICSVEGTSSALTITYLINHGNVSREDTDADSKVTVNVGGLIGGICGASPTTTNGEVTVKESSVSNATGCTVYNGSINTESGYGESNHTGGFIGFIRGKNSTPANDTFSDNCKVENVAVSAKYGFTGGFGGWVRGSTFNGCKVLSSSVKVSTGVCYAAGLVGCAYDTNAVDCIVKLDKGETESSLYAGASECVTGGIVGWSRGDISISGSKAFIDKMCQATEKASARGWIQGTTSGDGTRTISNCWMGGTYYNASSSSVTITLASDSDITNEIVRGTSTKNTTVSGTKKYWDGTL